ncbi:MAG: hypothetical protein FRX49_03982 [Trebouxia sp. A1-2]|nr:MAG: hypothetical protein FRX49_03982 [Trebouxia sp. A1-2]
MQAVDKVLSVKRMQGSSTQQPLPLPLPLPSTAAKAASDLHRFRVFWGGGGRNSHTQPYRKYCSAAARVSGCSLVSSLVILDSRALTDCQLAAPLAQA